MTSQRKVIPHAAMHRHVQSALASSYARQCITALSLVCCATSRVTPSPREMHAEIIGPYHDGEHSLTKTEVEKTNGVEPRCKPHASRQRMLLDLNFDLLAPRSFRACF